MKIESVTNKKYHPNFKSSSNGDYARLSGKIYLTNTTLNEHAKHKNNRKNTPKFRGLYTTL